MKEYAANNKRTLYKFNVGDLVFVKLRPYRHNFVEGKHIHKLYKCYYGPFKLVKAIGEVEFELELPSTNKIHLVFHVSQLKPCFPTKTKALDLPPKVIEHQPLVQPLFVLDWKLRTDDVDKMVRINGMDYSLKMPRGKLS